jgi:lipoate-protein ligase A
MFSVLKVPSEKIKDKMIQDVKARVTGLKKTYDEVAQGLQESFTQKFESEIFKDDIKTDEEIEARILAKYKYGSDEWNYKR